jgi:hypothetical protein
LGNNSAGGPLIKIVIRKLLLYTGFINSKLGKERIIDE